MIQKNKNDIDAERLLSSVEFVNEKMYTWNNWESTVSEILSRFKDETVMNALNILKKSNRTLDLLYKALEYSYKNVWTKSLSLNAYLEDLSDPNFLEIINWLEENYDIDNSQIIIEILEDNYWKIDENTIKNIKSLQKLWFKISIDDLSLYENIEKNNLSAAILVELLDNDIIPDYVKIDGPFLQKIINNKVSTEWINMFKELLKKLKSLWVEIVWEWIHNEKEWIIAKELWVDLFQWRELKDDFNLQNNIIEDTNKVNIPFSLKSLNDEIIKLTNFFSNEVNETIYMAA